MPAEPYGSKSVFESRCTICNPVEPQPERSNQQLEEDITANPSFGRVCIYKGETGISLGERVGEHMYDLDTLSKSNKVKH